LVDFVDDGVVQSVVVHAVTAERNDDEGLEVDGVHSIQLQGGFFNDNSEAGLDIDDSFLIQILDVEARGNGEHGLQVTAGDDGLEYSVIQRVLVVDSIFADNTGDGII
jgi:hypothetical protein